MYTIHNYLAKPIIKKPWSMISFDPFSMIDEFYGIDAKSGQLKTVLYKYFHSLFRSFLKQRSSDATQKKLSKLILCHASKRFVCCR